MNEPRQRQPKADAGAGAPARPPAAAAEGAAAEKPAGEAKLTPQEQMELFEKHLKENDWGHQPC